jgi:uncharacterized protein (DUF488 family)
MTTMATINTQRKRALLGLLRRRRRASSRKELMKLAFLLRKHYDFGGVVAFYRFAPHRYGPYSVELARDVDQLLSAGVVAESADECLGVAERERGAVDAEVAKLPNAAFALVKEAIDRFGNMNEDEMLAYVYRRYPDFAVRSEIWNQYLEQKPQTEPASSNLCTIGYEGDTVDGFLARLVRAEVDVLIDVRKTPLSRKYGFSKTTLSELLKDRGITYLHLPELGIPSDKRRRLASQADYQALFADYQANILPAGGDAVDRIVELVAVRRAALCCFEETHDRCHRGVLSEHVAKRAGLTIAHL